LGCCVIVDIHLSSMWRSSFLLLFVGIRSSPVAEKLILALRLFI
jgi:hypothetical protein